MHPRQDPSPQVRELAAVQCGLISAEQATILGLGNQSLRRLVRQDHWARLAHGVYDSQPGVDSIEKQIWGAALRAGDPCAVGGEAALRLYGLDRRVSRIVLWVPAERRPRSVPGITVRRDKIGRIARRRGLLPRLRAEDAVIDVAEHLDAEAAVALISDAVRNRLVTLRSLRAAVTERTRVRHRKLLLTLLADLDGIESTLEYTYRRDVERAHGLPRATRQESASTGTRSDVLYEAYRLLIELDGKFGHIDASSAFRDLRRDNIHALRTMTTLRYGSADVRGRPCEIARQVCTVLYAHGWTGSFQPCPNCLQAAVVGYGA
ncbi:MAG: type IV toxin-antitoxin system AbiEi family antitoxin domain-containing protein [Propionicimonas sp.]